jgi:hypothetical protein
MLLLRKSYLKQQIKKKSSYNESPHHRQRVPKQSAKPCAPSRLLNFPPQWPIQRKTTERGSGKGSSGKPD